MKNQRYHLLTTSIVSALHPNEPQQAGSKWEPTNAIDVQEAKALCSIGYAEPCDAAKGDTLTPTVLQRQSDAAKAKTEQPNDIDPGVNTDPEGDEVLQLILDGSVETVAAELDGLTVEELQRLNALEAAGKQRKGVASAIEDAIAALQPDQE